MTTLKEIRPLLRRDTQLRRERLVRAAIELYASDGFEVPLEKIADRAKVGRATLYRNFPDREALSVAVMEAHLHDLATQVAQWGDRGDAFVLGVRVLANKAIVSSGLEKIVPLDRQAPSVTRGFRQGVEDILAAPLARAKAAGLIRADFDISNVHRVVLMVAGGGLDSHRRNTAASIEQALQLLMRGLAP